MSIRPLTGQVLIEILPRENITEGGIALADRSLSPEEVEQTHRNPTPPEPWKGIVRSIGPWPKLKNGMAVLPEYGIGARVIIGRHAGIEMERRLGERLRMVNQKDVLAVIQNEHP